MISSDSLSDIQRRLARLERQARLWKRAALTVAAGCVLTLVGWGAQDGPADSDLELPTTGRDASGQAAAPNGGDRLYPLTHLEWIAVRSNAMVKRDTWNKFGFIIQFVDGAPRSDTIRIVATYDKRRVNREVMNAEMDAAGKALAAWAKQRGWDQWLNVGKEFVAR